MWAEIDACLLKRQLEINESEDVTMHDHGENDGENEDGNKYDDGWIEGAYSAIISDWLAAQDFYDVNEAQER